MSAINGKPKWAWLPTGYQKLSVTAASASGLSSPNSSAFIAVIQAEGGDIRWRDDGTNPTATDGMLLQSGDMYTYFGDLSTLKFIGKSGSVTVHVSTYA